MKAHKGVFRYFNMRVPAFLISRYFPMQIFSSASRKRRSMSRASLFLTMCFLTVLFVACGSGSPASAGSSTSTSASSSQTTCNKSTGFTLYSAQGYDSDAAKAFQQQTGITTKLVDDSTGNLLAKISAEGSSPQWDVTWFDGNVTMQTLADQGLLLKWHAAGARDRKST